MVFGENWFSVSIVIVILFNNNKILVGGYKISGVTYFGVLKYLGGKIFYDYKKYKLLLLVCGL